MPRSLNEKADYLSKIAVDCDDWELAPEVFGNWTSSGGRLLLIALPLAITGWSQNIFQDSGILGQPELTRFSKTGNTKIS